jgi:hypothetical protein
MQQGGDRSITAGENQLSGSTTPVNVEHGTTPREEARMRFTLWKQPDPFQGFSKQRDCYIPVTIALLTLGLVSVRLLV